MKMNNYLIFFVIVFNFIGLEFKCLYGDHECGGTSHFKCIPQSWVCDFNQDCNDNSDEVNCPPLKCDDHQFKCHHSSFCISKEQVCDGQKDCLDNEDELHCNISKCDPKTHYDCGNTMISECIPLSEVCKTNSNCTTKKDLEENCSSNMCKKFNPCSHTCINKFSSYICDCPDNMALADDKRTCKLVDKCYENPSLCEQDCKHGKSNYECFCYHGYTKDGRNCKPMSTESVLYLFFSSRTFIYSLPLFETEKKFSKIVIDSSYDILSFDNKFNDNDMVIYSSVANQNLVEIHNIQQWQLYNTRVNKIGTKNSEIKFKNETLFRTALDPGRNLLFFTDMNSHSIFVMNLTNSDEVKLIEDCGNPYHIVIDPVKGRIFWIDLSSSKSNSRIIMANMDGSNKTTLQSGLYKPTFLSIDIEEQRLYWVDHYPSTINYIDLKSISHDIQIHVVLRTQYFLPYSLYVFENRIYWSDWRDNFIYSAHKISGNDIRILTKSNKANNLKILSIETNQQLLRNINKETIAKYCSGSVNTCPSSCLPNYNSPEKPKCFGFPPKIKSNNNSLWLILIPVFLLGCLFIVLFKYRFTRTKVVRQPETGNVYIYDNVRFYEDQNSTCHENIDYSDVTPIVANTE